MKSLFFRLYLWGISLLVGLRPIKEKNIVILNGSGRSGSNGYLFYKYIKANHPDYNITLVEPWPSSQSPNTSSSSHRRPSDAA